MPARIVDRFSKLKVSRQRRWQLRQEAAKCCRICGEPALKDRGLCQHHYEDANRRAALRAEAWRNDPRSAI